MNKISCQSSDMVSVNVELGQNAHTIHIGENLIQNTGMLIKEKLPDSRCVIITDKNVARLYLNELKKNLSAQNIDCSSIVVDPGESSKSFDVFQSVVSKILDMHLERNDVIIGFGGGVIGDLSGFVASSVRRGMNFVQIPTSLLAQIDSSVGGKTGINMPQGKNLVGAFLQPRLVVADTGLLKTLSKREFCSGYAEMVKYALIDKPEFFDFLEQNHREIFSFGNKLIEAIAISCQTKADIVALDEFEQGKRVLLNLGHTFGHALEAATGYDSGRLTHGEGVAIGTMLAHEFSSHMNLCNADVVARIGNHFCQAGLPVEISDIPGSLLTADELLKFIRQDKKVSTGKPVFILTRGLGKSYIANNVPLKEVRIFLEKKLNPKKELC